MKNIEYQIAHAHTVTDLENEVARMMKEGWEPLGGVSGMRVYSKGEDIDTEFGENSYTYVQAMTRPIPQDFVYAKA
jgi:hypothetical protein